MSKHKNRPGHTAERQSDDQANPAGERLQKVLAAAGIGSRRGCEELITAGRIEVDRKVVTELGTRVDPVRQEIRVDGEVLKKPKTLYYAVNKPMGVVTTNFDPAGRPRVIDLVPTEERVFAVGRLDRSSEGLILVTNDGEFANRITHPRYGVEKTYLVRVAGSPSEAELAKLRKGVYLSDGFVRAQSVILKGRHGQSTDVVIVLNEGRNREIRRILARVGHKVLRLKRVAVGPLKLADLPVGNWRRLMPPEIDSLLAVAKQKRKAVKGTPKGTGEARWPKLTRSVSEGEIGGRGSGIERQVPGAAAEPEYVQKDALLSEPLSLDDLLRDDLDEGGQFEAAGDSLQAADLDDYSFDDGPGRAPGGVIDFEDDESASMDADSAEPDTEVSETGESETAATPAARKAARRPREPHSPRGRVTGSGRTERRERRPDARDSRPPGDNRPGGRKPGGGKPFGKKPFGKRPLDKKPFDKRQPAGGGERAGQGEEREALPRESYGRKRGGGRVYSPPHQGRGPAGETAGNFRFQKKSHVRGERNRTRPEGEGGDQAGEIPRKRFSKTGERPFARPAGAGGGKGGAGKKFAKPGGRRFGKSSEGPKPGKRGSARFKKPGGGKPGNRGGGGGKKGRR